MQGFVEFFHLILFNSHFIRIQLFEKEIRNVTLKVIVLFVSWKCSTKFCRLVHQSGKFRVIVNVFELLSKCLKLLSRNLLASLRNWSLVKTNSTLFWLILQSSNANREFSKSLLHICFWTHVIFLCSIVYMLKKIGTVTISLLWAT